MLLVLVAVVVVVSLCAAAATRTKKNERTHRVLYNYIVAVAGWQARRARACIMYTLRSETLCARDNPSQKHARAFRACGCHGDATYEPNIRCKYIVTIDAASNTGAHAAIMLHLYILLSAIRNDIL